MDSGDNSCLPGAQMSLPFGSNHIPNPGCRWSPTYVFSKILVIDRKYGHLLLSDLQAFNLLADSTAKVIYNINSYTNIKIYA